MPIVALTGFAQRNHFENPERAGTKFCGLVSPEHFVKRINLLAMSTPLVPSVIPGMEDFCSHLIVENWSDCSSGVVAITDENRGFIQSDYVKRRDGEPSYLARWVNASDIGGAPRALWLDLALYTREHLSEKEGIEIDGDFGIVNIAAHMTNEESPMAPSTVVRNALGTASGGNGAALDLKTNEIGADYWSRMIAVK